jgi:uncharacterized protein (UPF0303 family)
MTDNAAAIEALRAQERALVLPHFDEEAAYSLGTALRKKCAVVAAPVVIDIRSPSRRLFFAALPGSAPDNEDWARRKANVVLRRHESSMLAGEILKSEGRSQWPDAGLDVKDFALHGGGFPVRVRGVGVVASIAVSGLPSRQDHDMIVTALAEHLGVTDVARTPDVQPLPANSTREDQGPIRTP